MTNTKALIEKAIIGIAWEQASENVGIYPQSVTGGPNPYEKRTERMEGHNECVETFHEKFSEIHGWLLAIPETSREVVYSLLLEENIMVSLHDRTPSLLVNCSDTFWWGCADAEAISLEEIPSLAECYTASPIYGGELWCAKKRGMRPQSASYRECYPESEWDLFDACGPERTDADGRGDRSKKATPK